VDIVIVAPHEKIPSPPPPSHPPNK
jgi:hypothetical protein